MAQSVGAVALDIVMGKNTVSNVAKQAIQDVQKTFNDSSATIGNKASAVGTACKNIGASLAPVSVAAQAVIKLDRVYFAGLTKKNLGRGKWRYLNEKEVNALRMGAFE